MSLSVNKEKCISCGMCVSLCQNVFYFGEDGKADVNHDVAKKIKIEKIKECEQMCPVGAIKLSD
ncbi:MAG: ferredoxin [Candidatus Improbicoccus pseudotrichonymphae]|uniref:Ferredoxin n=1 Tax=Candidatus Improbicoccus pseudotrichonymphae TaxID=3033792 RepID=A0AA48HYK7_9FIRM|nr:MAG: ferredoxin [Candidatus Improbicoccus pseudotrichonymphae]